MTGTAADTVADTARDAPACAVLIPTHRRPAALARTLGALAAQDGTPPFETVICDDGSPDQEATRITQAVEVYRQSLAKDGRAWPVRLVRQANAGPAAARNAAARAAAAPLLVFLDDDCAPAPGWLAYHVAAHQDAAARAERVAVMGHVAWDPAIRVSPFMELVVRGAQFNYGAIADPERVPFTCFYTANCSLQRVELEAAGGFDASLPPFMEDTEFAYRLARRGIRIVYRPEALVYHEHAVELAPYLDRQRRAGRAAVQVALRHPELFDVVGVAGVADVALREQFYSALLRYAFVVGVEEGLAGLVSERRLTGEELRGQFERWLAHWAVRQASTERAWRERARALEDEVGRRDRRLAEVIQEKDRRIAALEAQLARIDALPPVRLLHALQRRLARVRHNGRPAASSGS